MNKILQGKIIEAFSSVLPITVIVLIASVILVPIPAGTVLGFIGGAALLIAYSKKRCVRSWRSWSRLTLKNIRRIRLWTTRKGVISSYAS